MQPSADLDATFAALADPTRRAIVSRLARGDATVLELAEPFAISLPAISRHLKVLEHAGLISRGKDAQRRPCRLEVAALQAATAWTQHTEEAWHQRLDRLDAYLRELKEREAAPPPAPPRVKPRSPTTNRKPKERP